MTAYELALWIGLIVIMGVALSPWLVILWDWVEKRRVK